MNNLKLSPQNTRLLQALEAGSTVTHLTAFFDLGIQSITARITELRDMGFPVETEVKRDRQGRRYASYYLDNRESHVGVRFWDAAE